jgi:hypothetical protein
MAEMSKIANYVKELVGQTEDPILKRLIAAYQGDSPQEFVEAELGNILNEVISHED